MKTLPLLLLLSVVGGALTVTPRIMADVPVVKPAEKGGAAKPYPLAVCIVTDNDLGSMGDEQVIVYEGQTVKFCCKPCEARFLKNPSRYLAKLSPEKKPE